MVPGLSGSSPTGISSLTPSEPISWITAGLGLPAPLTSPVERHLAHLEGLPLCCTYGTPWVHARSEPDKRSRANILRIWQALAPKLSWQ